MRTGGMSGSAALAASDSRGLQLVAGIAYMVAITNLQYGWTLFVEPIHQQYQWSRAAIQLALTLFILMETWLVPVEGGWSTR